MKKILTLAKIQTTSIFVLAPNSRQQQKQKTKKNSRFNFNAELFKDIKNKKTYATEGLITRSEEKITK